MRSKATPKASTRVAQGNATNSLTFGGENSRFKLIKQTGKIAKTPTGKGLGKAGAKRLGRLLKRAIQDQEEPTRKETPVRLFKEKIQTKAGDAPKTNSAKPAAAHISQLILSVVSQCKHSGGISMAELKQTLAAGGYDVTKNNRRVNVETNRLVNNESLVRTTRRTTYKLKNKELPDRTQVRKILVKPPKRKGELKQSTGARKSPRVVKSQRPVTKTPRTTKQITRSKSHKSNGKTRKVVARLHKPIGKARKPASKSHKERKTAPRKRKNTLKPAGEKRRSATNRATRVRKAPRKTLRTQRTRTQRTQRTQQVRRRPTHKSHWRRQRPKRRLPITRSLKHRQTRRLTYFYY